MYFSLFHKFPSIFYGTLAQLVEQRTLNPKVMGSNPISPTIENLSMAQLGSAHDLGSWGSLFESGWTDHGLRDC